ncbi:tetratricopeptide repeat protein [Comamonas sp. Tr-654]|uniref:tetratricopeptide repeat protein n=1 Tax=Comamonas sp. Tr-654 TaxID=2608341 RepID=UPI00196351B5|nr:tetratricopeptide repeat protein [Comamonas sp. Tr-654]NIF86056.1 tetratricopeptide repeat protein [Comamonas sp. Tr-654]
MNSTPCSTAMRRFSLQHFPGQHARIVMLVALSSLLSACGGLTIRAESGSGPATRNVAAKSTPTSTAATAPALPRSVKNPSSDGLQLARLMRDQARYEGAAEIYAQLEQRGSLQPLELLEYASVAARFQAPQDSLALYGRARRALREAAISLTPDATATLCNGLGRARMALSQTDAALADFDCTLAVKPDDVVALNAKGVLLDARREHEQARALLQRANDIDPADLRVLNNLALSQLANGDAAKAVQLLLQATQSRQTPLWASLQLNLAFAQWLQGQDDRATRSLSALMDEEHARQALADFATRRTRIRAGSPVAEELLAASRQWLPLRDKADRG